MNGKKKKKEEERLNDYFLVYLIQTGNYVPCDVSLIPSFLFHFWNCNIYIL